MSKPFFNEEFTFLDPDQRPVRVRGWGNQYYAVFETLDGYTVVQDPETKYYVYARLSEDRSQLLPTEVRVNGGDPQSLGLQPHTRVRSESARQQALESTTRQGEPSRWRIRRERKKNPTPTDSADSGP